MWPFEKEPHDWASQRKWLNDNRFEYDWSQFPKTVGVTCLWLAGISGGITAIVLLIWGIVSFARLSNEPDYRPTYEQREMKEKADVMRREGMRGSDEELSRAADSIKKYNEFQREQDAKRRRVLGE